MSEATPQPYEDNFTSVLLTALTGIVTIPQGEIDVHESSESSAD